MIKSILAALLTLLASVPEYADAAQTFSRTTVTDGISPGADLLDVQPGAASSAASSVGAFSATATADFGVIKLLANAPDANGLAVATGSFRDTVVLSGMGEFVPVTFKFMANGFVTNYNPSVGDWAYQVILDLTGTDSNRFQYVSTTVGATTSATGVFSLPVSVTGFAPSGVALDLRALFTIETSGLTFSAFNLDFSHTALLTEIGVPTGVTVTSDTFGLLPTNGSAFTYPAVLRELAAPSAAVPEPASWAFMVFGFGAVGVAMRSKKRVRPMRKMMRKIS